MTDKNSDSKIRRSARMSSRKRTSKINYKELEEGKEYAHQDESYDPQPQKNYEQEVLTKLKSKKGDVKLCHPKKSLTAYTLFVKIKRKELQEKFPDATTPELMKEIGRQWKAISEKDKEWYQSMASKDKERYKREMDEMNKLKEFHKIDSCQLKRPKKCLSSYMIFVREVRAKVTQDFPDMNALDVMKEVGRRWQSIDPEDKKYFQAQADKDKDRFKRENQQYMKELEQLDTKLKKARNAEENKDEPSQQNDENEKSRQEESKAAIGANGKKMRRDPSMPKKPLSAYIYFSQVMREQIKKENPKLSVASIMKEVTNRWSAMTEEEKEPYFIEAKDDKKRYENEIVNMKQKDSSALNNETGDMVEQRNEIDKKPHVENFSQNEIRYANEQKKDISPPPDNWMDNQKKYVEPVVKTEIKSTSNILPPDAKRDPIGFDAQTPKDKTSADSQFRFILPDNKPTGGMSQISPIPSFRKDMGYMGNYIPNDTFSGSTDHQQSNYASNQGMFRSNMFSPTPFGPNRSPGPSPNIMPSYSPMMSRHNDSYRDFNNRGNMGNINGTPNMMRQNTGTPFGNRGESQNFDYGGMNMTPSGFTPIRSNFPKGNPMFSPNPGMDRGSIFAPSPGMNSLSYQAFGYGRTPVNQVNRNSGVGGGFMARQPSTPSGQQQESKNQNQGSSGLFDLNPFG